MKRYLKTVILFSCILSLFFIKDIYALLIDITDPVVNTFTLVDPTLNTITFVPNNGDATTTTTINNGMPIGSFPTLSEYNDCANAGATYDARNCTYAYQFEGWYLENNFITEVNEDYVPTGNVTLYAKWNKVYFRQTPSTTCNGKTIIDTGIALFSEDNAYKDFIVTLTIDSINNNAERAAMFADMYEVKEPYQGVQFRWFGGTYNINANVAVGNKKNDPVNYTPTNQFIMKRESGILYYSTDGGTTFTNYQDYTNFNLFFDVNATFCAQYDKNGKVSRQFKGTVSNMKVELLEQDTYQIHFHNNGGSGMMLNQKIYLNVPTELNDLTFTYTDHSFVEWNTSPDGTGTSYANKEVVTAIGNKDDVIDLYAIWAPIQYYYVHFDANGGTGTMPNQRFVYNDLNPTRLNEGQFTKTGYKFVGWNTSADGSGTEYNDKQLINTNLTSPNNTFTLYAQYLKYEYNYSGNYVLDGATDYIDTGVNLHSQTTINKDFELGFKIIDVDPDNKTSGIEQPTIMNAKDETNLNKWPGFVVRLPSDDDKVRIMYKWDNSNGSTVYRTINASSVPIEIVFKRHDGVVSVKYKYGNTESDFEALYDQDDWTLNQYFPDNITFGAIYDDSHNVDRYFKGTIADMYIAVEE